ncbi:hypothetical protein EI555_019899, partial [Monodon monoceros]
IQRYKDTNVWVDGKITLEFFCFRLVDKGIGSRIHIVMKSDKEIVCTLMGFDDFVNMIFIAVNRIFTGGILFQEPVDINMSLKPFTYFSGICMSEDGKREQNPRVWPVGETAKMNVMEESMALPTDKMSIDAQFNLHMNIEDIQAEMNRNNVEVYIKKEKDEEVKKVEVSVGIINAKVPLGRSIVDIVIIFHRYITLRVLIIKKSLPSPRPIGNTGLLHRYMSGEQASKEEDCEFFGALLHRYSAKESCRRVDSIMRQNARLEKENWALVRAWFQVSLHPVLNPISANLSCKLCNMNNTVVVLTMQMFSSPDTQLYLAGKTVFRCLHSLNAVWSCALPSLEPSKEMKRCYGFSYCCLIGKRTNYKTPESFRRMIF